MEVMYWSPTGKNINQCLCSQEQINKKVYFSHSFNSVDIFCTLCSMFLPNPIIWKQLFDKNAIKYFMNHDGKQ